MENPTPVGKDAVQMQAYIMEKFTAHIRNGAMDMGSLAFFAFISHCHAKKTLTKRKAEDELPRESGDLKQARVE
jgi:hypothetical protein